MNPYNAYEFPEQNNQDNQPFLQIAVFGGSRIGAAVLDAVFFFLGFIPISFALLPYMEQIDLEDQVNLADNLMEVLGEGTIAMIGVYVLILPFLLYFVLPLLTKGKTLGKLILGHRIINEDGTTVRVGALFLRSLIYTMLPLLYVIPIISSLTPFILLGFVVGSIVMVFNPLVRRSIHDSYSKTLVVFDREYKRLLEQRETNSARDAIETRPFEF